MYRRTMIPKPRGMTLNGFRSFGNMRVAAPGKPPKLRWRPGQFVRAENQLWEIIFAYRRIDEPFEWIFCLEERRHLSSEPDSLIGAMVDAMGCGSETPRIVYEMFYTSMDAHSYFFDIPAHGNRKDFGNKELIQKGKVVSSGPVEPGGEIEVSRNENK